jgi:hypothetical protein
MYKLGPVRSVSGGYFFTIWNSADEQPIVHFGYQTQAAAQAAYQYMSAAIMNAKLIKAQSN